MVPNLGQTSPAHQTDITAADNRNSHTMPLALLGRLLARPVNVVISSFKETLN
jgi:hypothetical protein